MAIRKVLTPPKRGKNKNSISSDEAYRRKQKADQFLGSRTVYYPDGSEFRMNKKGYLAENATIPVGAASKTNKVRWKKPSPVIKRTTRTTKRK